MSNKADSEKLKLIQDKCQAILGNLLREEDNKYCVDCDAKGPRWASWNLGIFLCIRCAGIHRNLGVHISKVKSVNLDTWTPEQVAFLKQMGNSQARAIYEAHLPENFRRPQTDSSLEAFIRGKYEQKKYIAKEWVPPPPPPPAFDIEEEKKKERERKKNKTKVTNIGDFYSLNQAVTAVPRPHSTGPHSPAMQSEPVKNTEQVPDSSDLLNLGSSSVADIFDEFLSSSMPTVPDKVPASMTCSSESPICSSSVSNEETDFFNQKVVSDSTTPKMTKESILSLYGSNAVQIPQTPHIPNVYAGSVYMSQQAYPPVNMPGYAPIPAQGISQTATNMAAVYSPFTTPTIRQEAVNQPSFWINAGGRDESLLMTQGMGQVTQQMANLQLQGQPWNMTLSPSPINAPGVVLSSNNPTATQVVWPQNSQNQNLAQNFWQ